MLFDALSIYIIQRIAREMLSWSKLRHNHVLPFYGFIREEHGSISLVSPWQNNGCARAFIKGKPWKVRINVVGN